MTAAPGALTPAQQAALDRIRALLGPAGIVDDPAAQARYCRNWRGTRSGEAALIARPANAAAVAGVLALAAEARLPVVPQGGNTGFADGALPHEGGRSILLSLERMKAIRAVDAAGDSMIVEAGCVLADVRRAAAAAGRLFPLSLGAEGSAQIGGLLSTNAGGIHVLRYGSARALTLGLEAALPDGRVWNGLRALRKDNAGYDLKQAFIGAEGTLGVITAAVLRLFPKPTDEATALLATPGPAAALALLNSAREAFAERLTAFELIQRRCLELAVKWLEGATDPLDAPAPWYALISLAGPGRPGGLAPALEAWLETALEAGLVSDGAIAQSGAQAQGLWRLREEQAVAQEKEGASVKHDISVPVAAIPAFLAEAEAALIAAFPGIRPMAFGHMGDGNIHFNPLQPAGMERAAFHALTPAINRLVHDVAARHGGSITAEHGVGRLRRAELAHYRDPLELALMRRLKDAFDPLGIMNPGVILAEPPGRERG